MEAWVAELTMWVVVLRADFLAIWQGDVARIARDSEISAAASVRFFLCKANSPSLLHKFLLYF
jgi:hypothetical protein